LKKKEVEILNELSLSSNKELFLLTLLQIKKDLCLKEEEFTPWLNSTSGEDVLNKLIEFYSNQNFDKYSSLQQIFYRLDIPEKKVKESKNLVFAEQVRFIARVTLERAFQKVYLRKLFSSRDI